MDTTIFQLKLIAIVVRNTDATQQEGLGLYPLAVFFLSGVNMVFFPKSKDRHDSCLGNTILLIGMNVLVCCVL